MLEFPIWHNGNSTLLNVWFAAAFALYWPVQCVISIRDILFSLNIPLKHTFYDLSSAYTVREIACKQAWPTSWAPPYWIITWYASFKYDGVWSYSGILIGFRCRWEEESALFPNIWRILILANNFIVKFSCENLVSFRAPILMIFEREKAGKEMKRSVMSDKAENVLKHDFDPCAPLPQSPRREVLKPEVVFSVNVMSFRDLAKNWISRHFSLYGIWTRQILPWTLRVDAFMPLFHIL